MLGFLKKLFGGGPQVNYKELVDAGAVVVDVRTQGEYQGGHIKGSLNIPLNVLNQQLGKIKKDKPVIVVCASGMRSSSARGILLSNGFKEVYNAGGWARLNQQL
jgi:rhodanese-related sulfurtransferase